MVSLIRDIKQHFKESKGILFRIALVVIGGILGNITSLLVPTVIVIYDLSKNKIENVVLLFFVMLLFSDSVAPFFASPGKNSKDVIIIIIGLYYMINGKSNFNKSYWSYFLFFLIVAFLGLILVNFEFLGFQKYISYALLLWIVPSSVYQVFKKGNAFVWLRNMVFVFALLYLVSILLSRFLPHYFMQYHGRFNGIHRNPNGVGIFATLFIMNMFLIKEKMQNFLSKGMFNAILIVFVAAILLSASRNAILSLSIFFVFRTFRMKFFVGMATVILLAISFNYLMIIAERAIEGAGLSEALRVDTISYASGRIFVWQACWLEIQNAFWFGHGFSFEEYSKWDKAYYEIMPMLIHNNGNIHNSYLTIWLNTGLIGLLSFLIGMVLLVLKNQFKSRSVAPFFFAALFLGFFESFMVASLNPYTWQLWFAFFISSVVFKKRIIEHKQPEKSSMAKVVS